MRRIAQIGAGTLTALTIASSPRAEVNGQTLSSPATQVGVPSSTSYVQTQLSWPNATGNQLHFDWRVDSEPGYDFLRVLVDGSQVAQWSGLGLGGHFTYPVTQGPHTIRWEYTKDSSVDRGRDMAWLDNIAAMSAGHHLSLHHFNARTPRLAPFAFGGTGGGFRLNTGTPMLALERPIGQAFAGTSGASLSSIQRQIVWPSGSTYSMSFDHLVDSEANYDFLRVRLDGAIIWEKSGYGAGSNTVSIPSAGAHTVAFEYYKDGSVDAGRDTAQVSNISAATDGATFVSELLDGIAVGSVPDGWTPAGASGGWRADDGVPSIAYLARSSPSPEPTVDGVLRVNMQTPEYLGATMLFAPDVGSSDGPPSTVYLLESDSSQSLFIGARVKSASPAVGDENGEVVVLLDANRPDTLLGLGCKQGGMEDRRIRIAYSSASLAQPTITSLTQEQGNCQGTWMPIQPADAWSVSAAVAEPHFDSGFVHLELRIVLRPGSAATSSVLADGKLGFAMVHRNLSGDLSLENVPRIAGRVIPQLRPRAWLTLDFTSGFDNSAYGTPLARPASPSAIGKFF